MGHHAAIPPVSEARAREFLLAGGWTEAEINAANMAEIQTDIAVAQKMMEADKAANPRRWERRGDDPLALFETPDERDANNRLLRAFQWPPPACKCADPLIVTRTLANAFRHLDDDEWDEDPVPKDGAQVGTVILLHRFQYYALADGDLDDSRVAPSALTADGVLLRMLLAVRIGNWPSLAHVISELLRSEAAKKRPPAFCTPDPDRDGKVDAYVAMLEQVQGALHFVCSRSRCILSHKQSVEVHARLRLAVVAALTTLEGKDWERLWSSPVSRGFHLMLVGYVESLATRARQRHHLDYDGGHYQPAGACASNLGWALAIAVELTPAWFWRIVHAGLIKVSSEKMKRGSAAHLNGTFDLDSPEWADEVRMARQLNLFYDAAHFDPTADPDRPILAQVRVDHMPLVCCMPAPITSERIAACYRRFSVAEWCAFQHLGKQQLPQSDWMTNPTAAANEHRIVRGLLLKRALDASQADSVAIWKQSTHTTDLATLTKKARDEFERIRRLELQGVAPTPLKRDRAARIQRAFRRHRRRRGPTKARGAGLAGETERLLRSIIMGVEAIECDGPSVPNWWWKRPRCCALQAASVSLPTMPMLELIRLAASKLLERRTEGWPLRVIAATGAAILPQLVAGVQVQLTRVHADPETAAETAAGTAAGTAARSVALWHTLAERRIKAVFYVHFVHPIRRMAWATKRIVLCWRARVLGRAAQSHLYALSIHQHSYLTCNFELLKARGMVCTRAEMEAGFMLALTTHSFVGPSLLALFACSELSAPPVPTDASSSAVSSVIYALLRNRDLRDSIASPAYIHEQLERAQQQWARYPDRDDGGSRWRSDRWRWNADCKWKPAPEPHVCWGCGKQECKRRAEQRAWDDRWDGGHAVRVALSPARLGRDPSGVRATLRPVPVLKLSAVEREGEVRLRPYAGAHLPEPFTSKMRLCPCPRCEKLERSARARYHDVHCQSADWPRHKRGAEPRGPARVFATRS